MSSNMRWIVLPLALVVPAMASAEDYVLTASHWGPAQQDAVSAAGGTVTFSHADAGIGLVNSDAPDFLADAMASHAFQDGAPDEMVAWQQPPLTQAVTPDDEPLFPLQWNMLAIEAPAAWAAGCTGAGVRVAVLDGGIDSDHPDLDDNLDPACSASFVPGVAWNDDVGDFWHGTHVAGIVAAEDNGIGVIGVAPEATIVGVKVLHGGAGSFGSVIAGILYAADPGPGCAPADVVNMSLGALFPKSGGNGPLVAALNKAVAYAAAQGVLVISASGGEGLNLDHLWEYTVVREYTVVPAESSNGIAVSATGPVGFASGGTDFRRPASYSNYGSSVIWVAAPGGDSSLYPSPYWWYDMVPSTNVGGWAWASGTSMAAPAAAGVAALIKGADPGISLGALKNHLAHTADDEGKVGHDPFYGRGFVNAYRACVE